MSQTSPLVDTFEPGPVSGPGEVRPIRPRAGVPIQRPPMDVMLQGLARGTPTVPPLPQPARTAPMRRPSLEEMMIGLAQGTPTAPVPQPPQPSLLSRSPDSIAAEAMFNRQRQLDAVKPAPSVLGDIAQGLVSGPSIAARNMIGGGLQLAGGMIPGAVGDALTSAGRTAESYYGRVAEAQTVPGQVAQTITGLPVYAAPAVATGGAASLVGAPAAASSLAGSLGAGAAGYFSEGGGGLIESRQRLADRGITGEEAEEMAQRTARVVGATGLLDLIPAGRVARGLFRKPLEAASARVISRLSKTRAGHAILTGLENGAQEAVTELTTAIMQDINENDPEAYRDITERLALAGGLGFAVGAGVGGVTQGQAPTATEEPRMRYTDAPPSLPKPPPVEGVRVEQTNPPSAQRPQSPGGDVIDVDGREINRTTPALAGSSPQQRALPEPTREQLVREWETLSADVAEGVLPPESESMARERLAEIEARLNPRRSQEEIDAEMRRMADAGGPAEPVGVDVATRQAREEAERLVPGKTPIAERPPMPETLAPRIQPEPARGVSPTAPTQEQPNEAGMQGRPQEGRQEEVAPLDGAAPGRDAGNAPPIQAADLPTEQLRTQFRAKSADHARTYGELDKMVRDGTLRDIDRDVVLEALFDAPSEAFKRATWASNARFKAAGRSTFRLGSRSGVIEVQRGLAARADRPGSPAILKDADINASTIALHEYGHFGYHLFLNQQQKDAVANHWQSVSRPQRVAQFREGLSERDEQAGYFAKSPAEWFAQAFAEWAISGVSEARMRPLFERIGALFRAAVERLRRRGVSRTAELEDLFRLLNGRPKPAPTASTTARQPQTAPAATPPPSPAAPPATVERPPENRVPESPRPIQAADRGSVPRGTPRNMPPLEGLRGRAGEVMLSDGTPRPIEYRLVEADAITPSHDARKGFQPNPDGDANERPYENPTEGRESRQTVADIAAAPKAALLLTDTPSPLDGPPVVDSAGRVLGGNARSMGVQLAYSRGGKPAETIRSATVEAAGQFGISPEAARGMRAPILVRMIPGTPPARGSLSRQLNQGLTTRRSEATDAVSRGKRIDAEAAQQIASIIGDRTVREALSDPRSAARLAQALTSSRAIDAQELPALYRGGEWTDAGKLTVEQALLGVAVPDVQAMADMPASIGNTLVRALPALVRLRRPDAVGGDARFFISLTLAMNGIADIRRSGAPSVSAAMQEMTITPEEWRRDPMAVRLMQALEQDKPTRFARRLNEYADAVQDAASGQSRILGGVQTREEAFDEVFTLEDNADIEGQRSLFGFQDEVRPPESAQGRLFDATKQTERGQPDARSDVLAADDPKRPDESEQDYRIRRKFREAERNTRQLFSIIVEEPGPLSVDQVIADVERVHGRTADLVRSMMQMERGGFVIADVPLSAFDYDFLGDDKSGIRTDDIKRYSQQQAETAPPIVAVRGGADGKLFVADGRHRLLAAGLRRRVTGFDSIRAYVPKTWADARDQGQSSRGLDEVQNFGPELPSRSDVDSLGFFSRIGRWVDDKMKGPMQSRQLLAALTNAGMSLDEMEWTGLADYLKEDKRVTPEEVRQFIANNAVTLQEKTLQTVDDQVTEAQEAAEREYDAVVNELTPILAQRGASVVGDLPAWQERARRIAGNEASALNQWNTMTASPDAKAFIAKNPQLDDLYNRLFRAQRAVYRAAGPTPQNRTSYGSYTLAGGQNYREVLLTLPKAGTTNTAGRYEGHGAFSGVEFASNDVPVYRSPHFKEGNIVAHIRLNDRDSSDGRRVLFSEEIQSDWHQQGRTHGYKTSEVMSEHLAAITRRSQIDSELKNMLSKYEDQGLLQSAPPNEINTYFKLQGERIKLNDFIVRSRGWVPDAPFKKTWHEMTMRRIIRKAVEEGYDAIAWTTGKTQNDRYNKTFIDRVDAVAWSPIERRLYARQRGSDDLREVARVSRDRLPQYVGEERAAELLAAVPMPESRAYAFGLPSASVMIQVDDLTIGEEDAKGMAEFYDQILRRYADKFTKKWGGKVRMGQVLTGRANGGTADAHMLDITDEMRASITDEGIQMFGPELPESDEDWFVGGFQPPRRPRAAPEPTEEAPIPPPAPALVLKAAAWAATQHDISRGVPLKLVEWAGRADSVMKAFADRVEKRATTREAGVEMARARVKQLRDQAKTATPVEARRLIGLAERVERAAESTEAAAKMRRGAVRNLRATASKLSGFSRLAQAAENADAETAQRILKPLSASERETLAKLGMGLLKPTDPAVTPAIRKANAEMLELMDHGKAGLAKAAALGLKRRNKAGKLVPLRGSGNWMPMSLNAAGRELMKDVGEKGLSSAKLAAVAEEMVESGQFDTVEEAMRDVFDFLDQRTRGVNHYFERSRTLLPERFIDFRIRRVLPGVLRRNARTVAAGQVFGGFDPNNEYPEIAATMLDLRQYGDDAGREMASTASALERYLTIELGRAPGAQTERRVVGNILAIQNLAKLSGLWTPIRNLGQPWMSLADAGVIPRLRAYLVEYPLFVGQLTPQGRRAERRASAAGSTTRTGILTENADLDIDRIPATLQSVTTFFQTLSERGNQVRADIIGRLAAERDLRALMALENKTGPLHRLWAIAMNGMGAQSAKAAIERRMSRMGLTPNLLAEKIARGQRLTPEELDVAGWHAAHDTQFAMTTASKPIFYELNPTMRLLTQYKIFGARQLGLVVERYIGEAARGNWRPLAALILSTLVFNELFWILRDYFSGSDRSVSALKDAARKDAARELAIRAAKHVAEGGAFGSLTEVNRGLGEWMLGPSVGTVVDGAELLANVAVRPTPRQASMATQEFVGNQVPALRSWSTAVRSALKTNERAILTARIRSEAASFARRSRQSGMSEIVADEIRDRFVGLTRFDQGPATLAHKFAARAITAGDVESAATYLADVIRGANGETLEKRLTAIRSLMSRSAPLGGMTQAARSAYLASLNERQRRTAIEVDREWRADFAKAIRSAVQQSRSAKAATP